MNVHSYVFATAKYNLADRGYLSVSGLLAGGCVVILLMMYATSKENVIVHSTTDTDTAMIVTWLVADGEVFWVVQSVIISKRIHKFKLEHLYLCKSHGTYGAFYMYMYNISWQWYKSIRIPVLIRDPQLVNLLPFQWLWCNSSDGEARYDKSLTQESSRTAPAIVVIRHTCGLKPVVISFDAVLRLTKPVKTDNFMINQRFFIYHFIFLKNWLGRYERAINVKWSPNHSIGNWCQCYQWHLFHLSRCRG